MAACSLALFAGCSLVGAGIGNIVDASAPDEDVHPLSKLADLNAGEDICLVRKDGSLLNGEFQGIDSVPEAEYADAFMKRLNHCPLLDSLPTPGEMIVLVMKDKDERRQGTFLEFGPGTLHVRLGGSDEHVEFKLVDIDTLYYGNRSEISGEFLLSHMDQGAIPVISPIRVFGRFETVQIPVAGVKEMHREGRPQEPLLVPGSVSLGAKKGDSVCLVGANGDSVCGNYQGMGVLSQEKYAKMFEEMSKHWSNGVALPFPGESIRVQVHRGKTKVWRASLVGFDPEAIVARIDNPAYVGRFQLALVDTLFYGNGQVLDGETVREFMRSGYIPYLSSIAVRRVSKISVLSAEDVVEVRLPAVKRAKLYGALIGGAVDVGVGAWLIANGAFDSKDSWNFHWPDWGNLGRMYW